MAGKVLTRASLLGLFAAFLFICACFVPSVAFATEDIAATHEQVTTASVTDGVLTVESYLQNSDGQSTSVRPTDYIFVLDQSIWMNGTNGAKRAEIISALNELVSEFADPTTGENRVAIAGYGRVNVGTNYDPYDATEYPGTYPSSSRVSLNTGYYTTSGFKSYQGWKEVSNILGDALPTMPDSYFSGVGYTDCFMSETDALSVLQSDSMCAWFSGASRMDAGFALAEKLAEIATDADPEGERDLSVVFVSSSLPILQKADTKTSYIRSDAVLAASKVLKETYGANIFAFGDYHPSGREFEGGNLPDTEESFNTVMTQICNRSAFYFPLGESDNLGETLEKLVTEVSIVSAGNAVVEATIAPETIVDGDGTTTLAAFMGNAKDAYMRTDAKVQVFDFTGFDESGQPVFSTKPRMTYQVPLTHMVDANDDFSFTTGLIPVPDPDNYDGAHPYGSLVRITLTNPVEITYAWGKGSQNPPKVMLPDPEYVLKGEEIDAPYTDDDYERYEFVGWYTDEACTHELAGEAVALANMTLYGKWERQVLVEFYWDKWTDGYDYPNSYEYLRPGETPVLFEPDEMNGCTFEGWYLDKDCTQRYTAAPIGEDDLALYAKWVDPNAPEETQPTPEPEPEPGEGDEKPGDTDETPDESGKDETPDESGKDETPTETPDESGTDETPAETPATPEVSGSAPANPAETVVPVNASASVPDTGIESLPYAAAAVAGIAFLGLARLLKRY